MAKSKCHECMLGGKLGGKFTKIAANRDINGQDPKTEGALEGGIHCLVPVAFDTVRICHNTSSVRKTTSKVIPLQNASD